MDLKTFARQLDVNRVVVVIKNDLDVSSLSNRLTDRRLVAVGFALPKTLTDEQKNSAINIRSSSELKSSSEAVYRLFVDKDNDINASLLSRAGDNDPIDIFAYAVKDASPDSLLAVLLLLALSEGVEDMDTMDTWMAEVLAWKRGQMPKNPERSWSAMVSTLSHTLYEQPAQDKAFETENDTFRRIWHVTFSFLVESIVKGLEPSNLPEVMLGSGRDAVAAMHRLRQIYRDCLAHAEILQLSLPVRMSTTRRTVIDAIICVEHESSDALKIFGRSDLDSSPGAQGFGLIMSYRPAEVAWNQFTIHTDPTLGLDLTELWSEIEIKETDKYRTPNHAITRLVGTSIEGSGNHSSFTKFDLENAIHSPESARHLEGVRNSWVNPWFISHDGSLIASPGQGPERIEMKGTRLSLQEVTNTLWRQMMPLRSLKVEEVQPQETSRALRGPDLKRACDFPNAEGWRFPKQSGEGVPVFRYLRWPRDDDATPSLLRTIDLSTTAYRIIATMSNQCGLAKLDIADLVSDSSYRHIRMNGGFAVVAERGCTVVDDWGNVNLNIDQMFEAMRVAAELSIHAAYQSSQLPEYAARLVELSGTPSHPFDHGLQDYLLELTEARADQVKLSVATSRLRLKDDNAVRLFDEMIACWKVESRLRDVVQELGRLEDSVKALTDTRSGLAIKILGLWGIPIILGGRLAEWIVDLMIWATSVYGDTNLLKWLGGKLGMSVPIGNIALKRFEESLTGAVFVVAALLLYFGIKRWIRRQSSRRTNKLSVGTQNDQRE